MEKTHKLSKDFITQVLEQEYANAQETLQSLMSEKIKARIRQTQKTLSREGK